MRFSIFLPISVVGVAILIGGNISIQAQVPTVISYQGILTDANGIALPDGEYDVTFQLYAQPTGGAALWSETQRIRMEKGVFNVILGSVNALNGVDFSQPLWLGITVAGQEEFRPRVQLTAVPYSLMAKRVEQDAIGTFEIADGSITLSKINTEGASKGQIMKFDGDRLVWDWDLAAAFTLPFQDTVTLTDVPAFWIVQKGVAPVARFEARNDGAGSVLEVISEGPAPAIEVENRFPVRFDASAIRAVSEGIAPTIYVSNTGDLADGSAIVAYSESDPQNNDPSAGSATIVAAHGEGWGAAIEASNFGKGGAAELYVDTSSRSVTLNVESFSRYHSTVARFAYGPVAGNYTPNRPVVEIWKRGHASDALRVIDSLGSGYTAAFYKPRDAQTGQLRNKAVLYAEGATDRYFDAPIARLKQTGSGYGLMVDLTDSGSVAAGVVVQHQGRGTGVKVVTERLQESLQTPDIEASFYVENRSHSSSPVVFVYNKSNNSTGVALDVLQRGGGIALRVVRADTSHSTSAALFKGWTNGTPGSDPYADDAVVRIESDYLGFVAGVALSVKGGVVMESRGFFPALRLRANPPMITALVVDTGSVEFGDDLQVDGSINSDTRITVGGVGLNSVVIQRTFTQFPGDLSVGGNVGISGNLTVSGTITKGGGSFRIDHPLDPENKYLYHFFVESSEMKNVYDGIVVCDQRGEAVVELPEWFEALNEDFRYQLTCVGGYAPVYIKEEIRDNRFVIAGGKPGLKVSWQVTGIRKDKWALEHRMPIEQEKPRSQRMGVQR